MLAKIKNFVVTYQEGLLRAIWSFYFSVKAGLLLLLLTDGFTVSFVNSSWNGIPFLFVGLLLELLSWYSSARMPWERLATLLYMMYSLSILSVFKNLFFCLFLNGSNIEYKVATTWLLQITYKWPWSSLLDWLPQKTVSYFRGTCQLSGIKELYLDHQGSPESFSEIVTKKMHDQIIAEAAQKTHKISLTRQAEESVSYLSDLGPLFQVILIAGVSFAALYMLKNVADAIIAPKASQSALTDLQEELAKKIGQAAKSDIALQKSVKAQEVLSMSGIEVHTAATTQLAKDAQKLVRIGRNLDDSITASTSRVDAILDKQSFHCENFCELAQKVEALSQHNSHLSGFYAPNRLISTVLQEKLFAHDKAISDLTESIGRLIEVQRLETVARIQLKVDCSLTADQTLTLVQQIINSLGLN